MEIKTSARFKINSNLSPIDHVITFHYNADGELVLDEFKPLINKCPYRHTPNRCIGLSYHPTYGIQHTSEYNIVPKNIVITMLYSVLGNGEMTIDEMTEKVNLPRDKVARTARFLSDTCKLRKFKKFNKTYYKIVKGVDGD